MGTTADGRREKDFDRQEKLYYDNDEEVFC